MGGEKDEREEQGRGEGTGGMAREGGEERRREMRGGKKDFRAFPQFQIFHYTTAFVYSNFLLVYIYPVTS